MGISSSDSAPSPGEPTPSPNDPRPAPETAAGAKAEPPTGAAPPAAPAATAATPSSPPATAAPAAPRSHRQRSALARFVSENTNVVSSFVIGIAGLAVTTTYQCNQGELQKRQAEAQMRIAREQADNSWRIERAKILSENLKTLTARGGDTVEQRYGVLLSLLRGSILEPDVAVSYALELGRDNPDYMRSVLTNIDRKDEQYYRRLETAYVLTCEQRYGVSSQQVAQCASDKWAERSAALANTVLDNLEDLSAIDGPNSPMCLLHDEREVYPRMLRLIGLFTPFLHDLYERRMWGPIDKFLAKSAGAKLVGTMALALASNDFSTETDDDRAIRQRIEAVTQGYLAGTACDAECRLRVFAFALSNLSKSRGIFERVLRSQLLKPRPDIDPLLNRLSTRIQFCQYDPNDTTIIRDGILQPVIEAEAFQAKPDLVKLELLLSMLADLPEPTAPLSPAWQKLVDQLGKMSQGRYPKQLADRRADVQKQRRAMIGPPKPTEAGKKRPNFCMATDDRAASDDEE